MTNESSESAGVLKETFQALNRFLFGYGTPVALGVYRIFMASLTLISLLIMSLNWDAFFSEKGYVPEWLGRIFISSRVPVGFGTPWSVPRINVLSGVTDPRIGIAVYFVICVSALFTALGLWTRVSSIILAIGLVSLQHRNAAILAGYDTVMRVNCMYLAMAPCGAACSLDRLIGLWKGRAPAEPTQVSMWPQRLIAYNLALLYLTTTWLKWGGGMWQDGTATYYPARLAEFYRFPVPDWVNGFPLVTITTYGTLVTEFALGTLVFFRPLRKTILILGILMHLHIELSMNVPLFSYLMISTYITFYDGEEVSAWAKRLGQRFVRFQATVWLPQGMQLTPAAAGFLRSVDPLSLVTYEKGEQAGWSAATVKGPATNPSRVIFSRSIGSWLFGWFPGTWDKILSKAIQPTPQEVEPVPTSHAKQTAKARR